MGARDDDRRTVRGDARANRDGASGSGASACSRGPRWLVLLSARRTERMFELTRGNLLRADAEALVNTVNCVGVMGKGVALQFKQAFPENFRAYEQACKRKLVQPGRMLV